MWLYRVELILILLNFELAGSSPKSFGVGNLENSINKEKLETSSFKTNPSQNVRVPTVEISHTTVESNFAKSSIASKTTPPLEAVLEVVRSSTEPSTSSNTHSPIPPDPPVSIGAGPPPHGTTPPPAPTGIKPGPCAPPPPPLQKSAFPLCPPRPDLFSSRAARPSPLGPHHPGTSGVHIGFRGGAEAPKAKLKPFFWDKVLANPDHSMVWHRIRSGSFQ